MHRMAESKDRVSRAGFLGVAVAIAVILSLVNSRALAATTADPHADVFPSISWETKEPAEVGLRADKLDQLAKLVGGRGCVVRHGYLVYRWGNISQSADVASAVKPVISTLLMIAVQEGKLPGVDARVADVEPRLKSLNNGKDAAITWRHLASQTSGYGLSESPGDAYAYNDFALALYYQTLTGGVFQADGDEVLRTRLADVLGFEDRYTFAAFGPSDRPGRLAISPRDLARFGLLYLRHGRWRGRPVVRSDLIEMAVNSPIAAETPLTKGQEADMLPNQRSLGGGKNITPVGPGYYSFNWWLNKIDRQQRRLLVDAPPDAFIASGHGGRRALWVVPSLDLVVSWNDATIEDHDASPGNRDSRCNQAARLMCEACSDAEGSEPAQRKTAVSIVGDAFHINGKPTYAGRTWQGKRIEGLLLNSRMVQGIFDDLNPETRSRWAYPDTGQWNAERNTQEFIAAMPEWRKHGLLCFTINLQGGSPQGYSDKQPWHNSAITPEGELRSQYMARLERILDRADELGMVAILGVFYFGQDERLRDEQVVRRALDAAVDWIYERGYTNVLIEVNNECNVRYDHAILRPERVHELIEQVKQRRPPAGQPRLLVSTSYGGGTVPRENVVRSADFLLIHGNGVGDPKRIAAMVRECRQVPGYRAMPILVNEDDHFDFDKPNNNMLSAISEYCSWGYFDPGKPNYADGYQSVPVRWGINTPRKKAFFELLKQITGE